VIEQLSLFGEAGQSKGLPVELLDYRPGLLDAETSAFIMHKLISETTFKQPLQKMYEKEIITPRLMAWYGEANNRISDVNPWTAELLMIKNKVEPLAGMEFNTVLLNYYRDGNDSVAWHSDKESVPGRKTTVASVSFGQVRSFDIRNKQDHNEKYSVKLENGSFLLMKAGLQDNWEHRIAKSTRPMKARLNLTFRLIG
jgi:alkylated DNA repair dioxygenase AlkB